MAAMVARYATGEVGKRIVQAIVDTGIITTPFLLAHCYFDHYHWAPLRQENGEKASEYRAKEEEIRKQWRMERQAFTKEIEELARKRASLLQEIENIRDGGENGN